MTLAPDLSGAPSATVTGTERGLLELDGVRTHYTVRRGLFRSEAVKAVDGVDLAIARGETLALVGESGSGKSTLGRTVLRLTPLTAGTVRYAGQDVHALQRNDLRDYRRRVGAVFQDAFASLSPYMRVADLVEEPLAVQRIGTPVQRRERVRSALQAVKLLGVRDVEDSYTHTLSGGQRQRVNVARSLVLEPEFLVLDEPVSMIDASSRAELLYLLRDLQRTRGLTYLFITHDLASARHFADTIAVLYLGKVVERGPVRRVLDDPKHPYTRALLAAVPEPDPGNRKRLRPVVAGEPPSPMAVPSGCPFHPRCPQAMPGVCDVTFPATTRFADTGAGRDGGGGIGQEVACHLYPPTTVASDAGAETGPRPGTR
jgi:oligopeptide/dipeptide ABC transporter ATP-binding protein